MTRDNTLITDPNSLFAISRALRKQIVETDTNPQNRNNAIRDEKHVAYKSTGKDGYETFKYDILTNLEQLDNYILELETVLGKITSDEDALRLAQEVRKAKKEPATPKKRGPKPKAKGAEETKGSGRYRGGAMPVLPSDDTLIKTLVSLTKSSSISDTLKEIIKYYLLDLEAEISKYEGTAITKTQLINAVEDIYDKVVDEITAFNIEDLAGTNEELALDDIQNAVMKYLESLPDTPAPLAPEAEKSLKQRRGIPIITGREFIVSTLSKLNILLIKLIAEYNGKILVNYKKFLQSDLEEIALKVIDTQRRFRELKDYLKDFEKADKSINITKFLTTIDDNFKKFTALSSRSIANFVNPNIQLLPNFSQQLSGTFEDPKQPFNLYLETEKQKKDNLDTRIDKVVKEYMKNQQIYTDLRDETKELNEEYADNTQFINDLIANKTGVPLTKSEKNNYNRALKNISILEKQLKKNGNKMKTIEDKLEATKLTAEYAFFPRGVV